MRPGRRARLVVLAPLVAAGVARADGGALNARASTEVAAYGDSDHVAVLTPSVAGHVENPTAGWGLDASFLVDVVSAASVDIISTASRRWTEVRQAGRAGASYKPGDLGVDVEGSFSSEPDYLAYAAGGSLHADLDDDNLSLLVGYGYGHDTIGRTGTPFSVYSHAFDHHRLTAGLSAPLDRRTLVSLTTDVTLERGDSSKPYRYLPLFAAGVAPSVPGGATLRTVTRLRLPQSVLEQLPLARDRFDLTARLAHRFAHATARVEGTLYDDSWNLRAFAGDARYLEDIGRRLRLGPHLRYYVQTPVSFWRVAYVASPSAVPALRTGDRELGPLMSASAGASARWAVGPGSDVERWAVGASFDATYTYFLDDLYITRRVAVLGAVTLEAAW